MKKILIFFIFSQIAFAQKTSVKTFLHFTGKIDKYPIEMTIEFPKGKDSVSGDYYYSKNGKDLTIYLKGILKNNEIKLTETTYIPSKNGNTPKKTGRFSLNLTSRYELSGIWQNIKKDKQFDVSLTCLENLTAFNPKSYTYKLNSYKGKAENTANEPTVYYLIDRLDIYTLKGEKIQTLSGFKNVLYNNNAEVELEDINFDGLLDIKIPIYFPDRTKYDSSFLYFVYDKTKNQFIRNLKLEELEYLFFDQKNKEFVRYEADGSGNETNRYYKWLNNRFYLIREVKSFENSDKSFYTEYQIKNSKSVKIKEYQK